MDNRSMMLKSLNGLRGGRRIFAAFYSPVGVEAASILDAGSEGGGR
jgi:hypothetical protein